MVQMRQQGAEMLVVVELVMVVEVHLLVVVMAVVMALLRTSAGSCGSMGR